MFSLLIYKILVKYVRKTFTYAIKKQTCGRIEIESD